MQHNSLSIQFSCAGTDTDADY